MLASSGPACAAKVTASGGQPTAWRTCGALELSHHSEFAPPSCDFWFFDECDAAVMDYDSHGNFLGTEATTEPSPVSYYLHVRNLTTKPSVPLEDYFTGRIPASDLADRFPQMASMRVRQS